MTCYLRLHEVLVGLPASHQPVDWSAAFAAWQEAKSVVDRERILSVLALEPVDIYDLPTADLEKYRGLIVSDRVDQEFLYQHRAMIRDYLDQGGVMVVSGEVFRPWLPGPEPFVLTERDPDAPALAVAEHPIFDGLSADDFGPAFGYGYHPAPASAEVLVSSAEGAVMYVDRESTAGTIVLHAGHTLLGYAARESAARRMIPQLLTWMEQEGTR